MMYQRMSNGPYDFQSAARLGPELTQRDYGFTGQVAGPILADVSLCLALFIVQ